MRAAMIAVRFASEPPLVSTPPLPAPNPMIWQNQRTTFASSCTSSGAGAKTPTYRFTASAIRSATAAWKMPPPGM